MNTRRRPKRCNSFPVGMVEDATPTTTNAIGSVARSVEGANSVPMMPASNTINEVPAIIRE